MKKTALIARITGQDGSYLAEFLLEKGDEAHGIKRRASSFDTQRIDHIYQDPHVDNAQGQRERMISGTLRQGPTPVVELGVAIRQLIQNLPIFGNKGRQRLAL